MKRFLIIVFAACGLAACKKEGVTQPVNIIGKWELARRYGGNILPQDTMYKAGNGNIWQFNSDSSYKEYTNGALTASGTFHMRNNELYFNNNAYNIQPFSYMTSISGNMLTFKPLMPDIATTVYDKISN
jgi:hypothetical protein